MKMSRSRVGPTAVALILASFSNNWASDEPVRGDLAHLLPGFEAKDLDWLAKHYGYSAVKVARKHGRRGAEVLVALDGEGLAILREQPEAFEKLAGHFGGLAAARFLVVIKQHVRELAQTGGLADFLARIEKLPPWARSLAERNPAMIPYLVISPGVAGEALRLDPESCRLAFPSLDLSAGPEGLERVARLILRHAGKCRPWAEARGLDGILLLEDFSPFLDRPEPVDLPVLLAILSTNQADLASLMADERRESAWQALTLLALWDDDLPAPGEGEGEGPPPLARGHLLRLACTDTHAIRWVIDHPGDEGLRVLKATWGESSRSGVPLPGLLYGAYSELTRGNAWSALSEQADSGHAAEAFQVLTLMARWPTSEIESLHPSSSDFHRLLAKFGARVVPYLAEAEISGEPTRRIRYERLTKLGERELDDWNCPPSFWVESIPLYDSYRLGWLLSQGCTPTQGEILFACVDVAFTAWDVASLGGGKAASSAAKGSIKTGGKTLTRQALEETSRDIVTPAIRRTWKESEERISRGLAGRLAQTPVAVRELARRGHFLDPAINAAEASMTAARLRIPLATRRVGNYFVKEWSINATALTTIPAIANFVRSFDSRSLVDAVKDAMAYFEKRMMESK